MILSVHVIFISSIYTINSFVYKQSGVYDKLHKLRKSASNIC